LFDPHQIYRKNPEENYLAEFFLLAAEQGEQQQQVTAAKQKIMRLTIECEEVMAAQCQLP
jgi:hypothetical protein